MQEIRKNLLPLPVLKPLGKIDLKKQQKRKALMDSAYELFTTVGYSRTTILSIAVRAGVGKGTFYNYFRDKEDIRDELIVSKSVEILSSAIRSLQAREDYETIDFTEKILHIIDFVIEYFAGNISELKFIAKFLSWGTLRNTGTYAGGNGTEYIDLSMFVNQALQEEGIRLKDPELVIFTLLELTNSTCYSVLLNQEPVPFEKYRPYLYHCIRLLLDDAIITED